MRITILCMASMTACAGSTHQVVSQDDRSWSDRMADARDHDRAAAAHKQAASDALARTGPSTMGCPDLVLNDQLTTGGVGRVTDWQPCWDPVYSAAVQNGFAAEAERRAAERDRRSAAQLVDAELVACRGVPEQERGRSVFARRQAIAEVLPHREAGQIRGAWIVFKPGVTALTVRRDIDCAHARWALHGKPLDEGATDPTLVPGASVQVVDRHDHVEVLVQTDTIDAGELALARARGHEVPRQQTAVR